MALIGGAFRLIRRVYTVSVAYGAHRVHGWVCGVWCIGLSALNGLLRNLGFIELLRTSNTVLCIDILLRVSSSFSDYCHYAFRFFG